MAPNPCLRLHPLGQSLWLDYIRRDFVADGSLARQCVEDGLRGLTSNPAIFEKAIAGSTLYDDDLRAHYAKGLQSPAALAEAVAVADVQAAADVFAPLWRESGGEDGWVSLEVAPDLAHDAPGTMQAGRVIHAAVARPNLMVKVPATSAGLQAAEQLLADGISINFTLIFSRQQAADCDAAYQRGAAAWLAKGGDGKALASVASFFISRVDSALNPQLTPDWRNRAGIANARAAYGDWIARRRSAEWQALAAKGARPQRLLWASTSSKDPSLPAGFYLDALIAPQTVNTAPPATIAAYRSEGSPADWGAYAVSGAEAELGALAQQGVDLPATCDKLLIDGLSLFADAHAALGRAIAQKIQS